MKAAFQNGKAFIAFLTCGDPDLATTEELIKSMVSAGVNLIELGIPFSDPTAEGPVIQSANLRALTGGTTTDKIFEMVKRVRKSVQIPMVFMTYANVVFSYGTDKFLKTASEIGMDGIILPDVPFEEKDEFSVPSRKYGMDFISLVAPTSKDRIEAIAREAEGFVYCVSSLGVTGVRSQITSDVETMVCEVRKATNIPVAIGFGISTPEQAADMAEISDGVIIGSAIMKIIEQYGCNSVPYVSDYISRIRKELDMKCQTISGKSVCLE
jgi:tryptophan synthase alpha chain